MFRKAHLRFFANGNIGIQDIGSLNARQLDKMDKYIKSIFDREREAKQKQCNHLNSASFRFGAYYACHKCGFRLTEKEARRVGIQP
jgi:hypothetical protein